MGSPTPRRTASTPAMNVVATAPRPTVSTPTRPPAGLISLRLMSLLVGYATRRRVLLEGNAAGMLPDPDDTLKRGENREDGQDEDDVFEDHAVPALTKE